MSHFFNGLGRHLALVHDLDHKDLVVAPPPALQGFAKRPFSQLLQGLILDVEGAPVPHREAYCQLASFHCHFVWLTAIVAGRADCCRSASQPAGNGVDCKGATKHQCNALCCHKTLGRHAHHGQLGWTAWEASRHGSNQTHR